MAIALFVLWFGTSNWFRQVNLVTAQFDMGNMDQVMWHSLHGQWFKMTSPTLGELQSRTAIHADFLLLGYLPFYTLWPDPRTLLILQVLGVASGAIALYLIAKRKLSAPASAIVAIVYLLYPPLEWATIFDVHAVVLATPLFLWAWWAAERKKLWLSFSLLCLAALSKEEIGLVVAMLGIYWLWQPRLRPLAIACIVTGLAWSTAMVGWAIPHARQAPGHFALGYFSPYGENSKQIVTTVLTHPWRVFHDAFNVHSFSLLRALLLPVGLMPLLAWPILLITLPELAINLLSTNHNLQSIFFHYMSAITPFIFLATVLGWARLLRWLERWPGVVPASKRVGLTMAIVSGAALVSAWFWAPLPGMKHHYDAIKVFQVSPYRSDVQRVQILLRPTDRVAATNNLAPQFSRRDYIWGFPSDLDHADAIVILLGGDYELLPKDQMNARTKDLLNDSRFRLILHHQDFYFFRRVLTT